MHGCLILNLDSYMKNCREISEESHIVILDYYVYSKVKDTKKNIYYINEFVDGALIESWHSFVGDFLRNLSIYLYDETLKAKDG